MKRSTSTLAGRIAGGIRYRWSRGTVAAKLLRAARLTGFPAVLLESWCAGATAPTQGERDRLARVLRLNPLWLDFGHPMLPQLAAGPTGETT